jgi:hypothetical protein
MNEVYNKMAVVAILKNGLILPLVWLLNSAGVLQSVYPLPSKLGSICSLYIIYLLFQDGSGGHFKYFDSCSP